MDSWDELNNATVLAEKYDKFEAVRKDEKRFERRQNSFSVKIHLKRRTNLLHAPIRLTETQN